MATKRSKRGQNGNDEESDLESLRDSFEEEEKSFSESESSYSSDEKRKKVYTFYNHLNFNSLCSYSSYNSRNHQRKSHLEILNQKSLKNQSLAMKTTMKMMKKKMILKARKTTQNLIRMT